MAKHMRNVMTWRDIKVFIDALPEEVQDMPAKVWLSSLNDVDMRLPGSDLFPMVTSITPFCENDEPSVDNPLSLNLEGCC